MAMLTIDKLKKYVAWDTAWSPEAGRWYYRRRVTGETSWTKPADYKAQDRSEPPAEKVPPMPDVEEGWKAIWDSDTQKFYFVNQNTHERTWYNPSKRTWRTDEDEEAPPTNASGYIPDESVLISDSPQKEHGHDKATSLKHSAKEGQSFIYLVSTLNWRVGDFLTIGPLPDAETVQVKAIHGSSSIKLYGPLRGAHTAGANVRKAVADVSSLLWDPATFLFRLAECKENEKIHKQAVCELRHSNEELLELLKMRIPHTSLVSYARCQEAILTEQVEAFETQPIVTISHQTVASAAAFFALDSQRAVCCLNFSSGKAGRLCEGYLKGRHAKNMQADVEGDLCRRIPNLHPSLQAAKQRFLYPFGPSTATVDAETKAPLPNHYHSVLYSPAMEIDKDSGFELNGLKLSRYGLEKGYEIYRKETLDRRIGVVSAAAPAQKTEVDPDDAQAEKDGQQLAINQPVELWDHKLISQSIISMLVAPVLHEPGLTTIVLGAWGVNSHPMGTPERMGMMFGDAISRHHKFSDFETENIGAIGSRERSRQALFQNELLATMSQRQSAQKNKRSLGSEFCISDMTSVQSGLDTICIGRLYHEIHFALPFTNEAEEKVARGFQKGLEKAGVKCDRIAPLDKPGSHH